MSLPKLRTTHAYGHCERAVAPHVAFASYLFLMRVFALALVSYLMHRYKKESEEIKDQSMTIKKLREQLRAAEEERDKLKKRAKKLMAEKYGTIVEPSEGDADSEQIITDDIDMAVGTFAFCAAQIYNSPKKRNKFF